MTEGQPPATFPNFAGKHDGDALFSSDDAVRSIHPPGERDWTLPEGIVLFYSRGLAQYLDARPGTRRVELLGITFPAAAALPRRGVGRQVADVLHEDGWRPEGIGAPDTRTSLVHLLEASFAALTAAASVR